MDEATIHIEGFPQEMTVEIMVQVFKRAGEIRHIKLPRLPDGQIKGFCFIEYTSAEQAIKACEQFNNCVPEEFTNNQNANFVKSKVAKVASLKVIRKSEWLKYKKDLSTIKKDISKLKHHDEPKKDFETQFQVGSLIRLDKLPEITKQQLTERIKTFKSPAYVDL